MASGIRTNLARDPGKVALICGDRTLTYAQLVDRIGRVASLGVGLGLRKGDRAAIVATNCLEYIEIVDGLAEAGIAVATPNPKQTAAELGYILNDCGARIVFASASMEALVRAADCPAIERIIVIGRAYEDLLQQARPATLPVVEEWDAFSIPYTSGTTGKPRGVVLPHRSRAQAAFCMASEYGCYGPDDRFLAITPMFHGAGYSFAHASVFFGGTCEILPSFEPEPTLRALSQSGATGTFMVPTLFNAIFALGQPVLDQCRTNRLRALMSNAAPLPAWAAGAVVFEDPAPDRLCLRYVIPRAFSHGQGATALRAVYGSIWHVLWSLATGAAQAVVFGVLAVLAFAIAAPRRAFLLDRAARGLGKVLWSRPFQVAFYGLTPSEAGAEARPAVL